MSVVFSFTSMALNSLQVIKIAELPSNIYSFNEPKSMLAFIEHETGLLKILYLNTAKVSQSIWDKPVSHINFSEDGKRIAIVEAPIQGNGKLIVANISTNLIEPIFEIPYDDNDVLRMVHFSPDGTEIYILSDLEISAFNIKENRPIALPNALTYPRNPPVRFPLVANMTREEQEQYILANLTEEERAALWPPLAGAITLHPQFPVVLRPAQTARSSKQVKTALEHVIKKTKEYKFMSMGLASGRINLSRLPDYLIPLSRNYNGDFNNFKVISSNREINQHPSNVMGLKNGKKTVESLSSLIISSPHDYHYFYTKSTRCALSPENHFVVCLDNASPTLEIFKFSIEGFNNDAFQSPDENAKLKPQRVPRLQDIIITKILNEVVPDYNAEKLSFKKERKFFINGTSLENIIYNALSRAHKNDISKYTDERSEELLQEFYNDAFVAPRLAARNNPLIKDFNDFRIKFKDLNNKHANNCRKEFNKWIQRKFFIEKFSRDDLENFLSKISLNEIIILPQFDGEDLAWKNFISFLSTISVHDAIWPFMSDKLNENHTFSEVMYSINQILISHIIRSQLGAYWRQEVRKNLPPILFSREQDLYIDKLIDLRVEQYMFPLFEKSSSCNIL